MCAKCLLNPGVGRYLLDARSLLWVESNHINEERSEALRKESWISPSFMILPELVELFSL
jgi:hypothetical protein